MKKNIFGGDEILETEELIEYECLLSYNMGLFFVLEYTNWY